MKVADPRLGIVNKIDLASLRVEIKSSPNIFLCGGQIEKNHKNKSTSTRCELMRHLLFKDPTLLGSMQIAEEIVDWGDRAIYKDLHVLERHVASISSLIILILESPGTIAELGMFCENEFICKKLLIFIEDDHYQQDSFIARGPIRLVESNKSTADRVKPYQLGTIDHRVPAEDKLMEFIHADIKYEINKLHSNVELDPKETGHVAFTLVSIVSLFHALTITEIQSYLATLIPTHSISQDTLRQLLFFLVKIDLLVSGKSGATVFYQRGKQDLKVDLFSSKEIVEHSLAISDFYASDPSQTRRHSFISRSKLLAR